MTKPIVLCIFLLFYSTNCQKYSSNLTSVSKFLGYNKIIFLANYRQTSCVTYMNKFYGPKNIWECSLLEPENMTMKHQIFKANHRSECLCSYNYECYDHEEFLLEYDLIDLNEYMKKENFIVKNIYTETCENGLQQLTDYYDWNCVLKYDRFHIDEYYCSCNRKKICRIEKVLKF